MFVVSHLNKNSKGKKGYFYLHKVSDVWFVHDNTGEGTFGKRASVYEVEMWLQIMEYEHIKID